MLSGTSAETGFLQEEKALEMQYLGDGYWHLLINIDAPVLLEYRYFVRENGQTLRREWGDNHKVGLPANTDLCTLYDFWQPEPEMGFLYTSAYRDCLLAVNHTLLQTEYAHNKVILKLQAPFVRKGKCIGISGDCEIFGKWQDDKAIAMQSEQFPEWSLTINANDLPENCNYKFIVLDKETGRISGWEWGEPRSLFTPRCMEKQMLMYSGMVYRFQEAPWKGSGVSIPVFSLRSENSWGCGDFGDLKKMIDWAEATSMQLIQLLPINDTTLSETWQDSYPYSTISIFALHPIYASIRELPLLRDKKAMELYETRRLTLNALSQMDYEKVTRLKWDYLHDLFEQEGEMVLQTEEYKKFFEDNCDWLVPYAAFYYLRKCQKSFDFHLWGEYSKYNPEKIQNLCDPSQPWYNKIAIHYYVQYQLHLQLKAARDYAHEHSVILKGDIPIGISRYGVEAWKDPCFFNMDAQIGAPPDDFSATGQNWGFPSYNWERIKADDFRWWKRRLQKMACYFDAYRIDHILGFFRIWEIPLHSFEGLLGHFSPALPLSLEEMQEAGFDFDEELMTKPYITDKLLSKLFGKTTQEIKKTYLLKMEDGRYQLKADFNTQQSIHDHFKGKKIKEEKDNLLCKKLFSLCNEVLFLIDTQKPKCYHPRILASQTECYKSLNPNQKAIFDRMYLDFFYVRRRFGNDSLLRAGSDA
jgi:4-alpha-glucanotransferase